MVESKNPFFFFFPRWGCWAGGWKFEVEMGQPGSGNDCDGERKRVFDDFIDMLVDDDPKGSVRQLE